MTVTTIYNYKLVTVFHDHRTILVFENKVYSPASTLTSDEKTAVIIPNL